MPLAVLSLPCFLKNDLVAQPVEHLTFNQRVPGSNPGEITIKAPCLTAGAFFMGWTDKGLRPLYIFGARVHDPMLILSVVLVVSLLATAFYMLDARTVRKHRP